jgi:hypothetical protein
MVRTAFLTFLLVTLVATSAIAARITPQRPRAHATVGKSTLHRARTAPAHLSHSKSSAHPVRKSPRSVATAHRTRRPVTHSATLKRTRYSSHRSKARYVPPAPLPAARARTQEQDDSASVAFDSAQTAAAQSRRNSEPSSDTASNPEPMPRRVEPSGEASAASQEPDTLPVSGADPTAMAAAGNALAAPREPRAPIVSTSGQVAELTRPPIFSGRVSRYTLRGTHDSLVRQNARSEEENLQRIENDADLLDRIARGSLVRVPESTGLMVNPSLPDNRRYCRPWTADFLTEIARAHHSQFHKPLIVSSAVRTVEYQTHLMRINGNAADAEGDIVSPHLTGATIDIAKSGLSRRELQWMRSELIAYQNAGVIDVEEEFHQRCFHITVYKNYGPGSPTRRSTVAAGAIPVGATSVTDGQDSSTTTVATPDNR